MKKIVRVFIYLSIAVSIILFVFCVIGITSAAMDGIKVAEAVIRKYDPSVRERGMEIE